MYNKLKLVGAAALVALLPTVSSALTLTLDDLSTAGVDVTETGATSATFGGTVGGFTVTTSSGSITSPSAQAHELNTTSLQTSGVGTLVITAEQTGLSSPSAGPLLNLTGFGSTSTGDNVTVEHFIDFGAGYQTVGNALSLSGFDSDSTKEIFANAPTFSLMSMITVVTSASNQSANVNSTLTAAVPVPAAGLLLLTALGGAAAMRRRKKS